MTNGTSQGLFVVVAIVIFGIFVGLSYTVFGSEGLTNDLKGIFENATEKTTNNLKNNKQLVYTSDKEVNYANDAWGDYSPNEFMWYGLDLSPLVEEHGLGDYIFEFEIKSSKDGEVKMYTQNGTTSKYWIGYNNINTTTEYKMVIQKVKISNHNETETFSQLAFYGVYGSELYSSVKNMRIYKVVN